MQKRSGILRFSLFTMIVLQVAASGVKPSETVKSTSSSQCWHSGQIYLADAQYYQKGCFWASDLDCKDAVDYSGCTSCYDRDTPYWSSYITLLEYNSGQYMTVQGNRCSDSGSTSDGAVAGGVTFSVFIIIIVLACICCRRRKRVIVVQGGGYNAAGAQPVFINN
jgi:hypothetical protein